MIRSRCVAKQSSFLKQGAFGSNHVDARAGLIIGVNGRFGRFLIVGSTFAITLIHG
jgi:hypothetical protein